MSRGKTISRRGNAMILTVFIIALAGALVMGMLQLNTEQTMQLRNQAQLAAAMATAEAGLNDAMARIRSDADWDEGFTNKAFGDGRYTVAVSGTTPLLTITSTGRTGQNYTARMQARITAEGVSPPHRIVIEELRMNP